MKRLMLCLVLLTGCALPPLPIGHSLDHALLMLGDPDVYESGRLYWCEPKRFKGRMVMLRFAYEGVILEGAVVDRWPMSCGTQLLDWSGRFVRADEIGLSERIK